MGTEIIELDKVIKLDKIQFGVLIKMTNACLITWKIEDELEACASLLLKKELKKWAKKLIDNKEHYKVKLESFSAMAIIWMLNGIDATSLDPYTWTVYKFIYDSLSPNQDVLKLGKNGKN